MRRTVHRDNVPSIATVQAWIVRNQRGVRSEIPVPAAATVRQISIAARAAIGVQLTPNIVRWGLHVLRMTPAPKRQVVPTTRHALGSGIVRKAPIVRKGNSVVVVLGVLWEASALRETIAPRAARIARRVPTVVREEVARGTAGVQHLRNVVVEMDVPAIGTVRVRQTARLARVRKEERLDRHALMPLHAPTSPTARHRITARRQGMHPVQNR